MRSDLFFRFRRVIRSLGVGYFEGQVYSFFDRYWRQAIAQIDHS
jgi:hypothetical protein